MRDAVGFSAGPPVGRLAVGRLPEHAKPISPAAISRIRKKIHANTPVLAAYLNVNPDTMRFWEKGRRVPFRPRAPSHANRQKQPQILASA